MSVPVRRAQNGKSGEEEVEGEGKEEEEEGEERRGKEPLQPSCDGPAKLMTHALILAAVCIYRSCLALSRLGFDSDTDG